SDSSTLNVSSVTETESAVGTATSIAEELMPCLQKLRRVVADQSLKRSRLPRRVRVPQTIGRRNAALPTCAKLDRLFPPSAAPKAWGGCRANARHPPRASAVEGEESIV